MRHGGDAWQAPPARLHVEGHAQARVRSRHFPLFLVRERKPPAEVGPQRPARHERDAAAERREVLRAARKSLPAPKKYRSV